MFCEDSIVKVWCVFLRLCHLVHSKRCNSEVWRYAQNLIGNFLFCDTEFKSSPNSWVWVVSWGFFVAAWGLWNFWFDEKGQSGLLLLWKWEQRQWKQVFTPIQTQFNSTSENFYLTKDQSLWKLSISQQKINLFNHFDSFDWKRGRSLSQTFADIFFFVDLNSQLKLRQRVLKFNSSRFKRRKSFLWLFPWTFDFFLKQKRRLPSRSHNVTKFTATQQKKKDLINGFAFCSVCLSNSCFFHNSTCFLVAPCC